MNTQQYKVFPYAYGRDGKFYNRLIVEPIKIPESVDANGLKIPESGIPGAGFGKVFATCEGSTFKPGDEVQYMNQDRAGNEKLATVEIEGKRYDVIYEHKVWAVNDEPYNQIFVRPISDSEVTEEGLLIPSTVESITKKGVIFKAPADLGLNPGDKVEYQNQMQRYYPEATIDGVRYEVLFLADIFKINEVVAPYRIIVKIDLGMQSVKRNTSAAGLILSPLFRGMLRNLQFAEVVAIGAEARKMYPELNVGETAIIDHGVESQDYRLLKYDIGKHDVRSYEYRIINCFTPEDREIFGKLHYDKSTNKIIDITPLSDSIFLEWELSIFEQKNNGSEILDTDYTISRYNNVDDLRSVLKAQQSAAAQKAKQKTTGIRSAMAGLEDGDRKNLLLQEFATIEREEKKIAAFLHRNHLVVCKTIFPRQQPAYVISPYLQLYPINLLGKKFLIGHKDFLIFKSHTNMNIKSGDMIPLFDNVLVLPQSAEKGDLIVPDSAQERPQYGTVVLIGDNAYGIKDGDAILFRKGAGLMQEIDGVQHLIMKQNDLLMALPAKNG